MSFRNQFSNRHFPIPALWRPFVSFHESLALFAILSLMAAPAGMSTIILETSSEASSSSTEYSTGKSEVQQDQEPREKSTTLSQQNIASLAPSVEDLYHIDLGPYPHLKDDSYSGKWSDTPVRIC